MSLESPRFAGDALLVSQVDCFCSTFLVTYWNKESAAYGRIWMAASGDGSKSGGIGETGMNDRQTLVYNKGAFWDEEKIVTG